MPASSHRLPPPGNRLLAALPADNREQILLKIKRVNLSRGHVLHMSGAPIDYVYFPETGMISLVSNLEDGVVAEVGVIGREGMLGLPLLAGVDTSFSDSIMQIAGPCLRMAAGAFREELETNAPLKALLFRYNEALHAQISQTAACNGRHDLKRRLARWLLMAHDCVDDDDVLLTQDFLASMLGVHRPSITITAGILQRAGLIRYAGGRITVLDRPSLEAASCECYSVVQHRFTALLG
jgi:CRP-like cAMP-binding protein